MIWVLGHRLLVTLYTVLPVVGVVGILWWAKPGEKLKAARRIFATAITSIVIGAAASIIYGVSLGGMVTLPQTFLTCYLVAGVLCIIKLWDIVIDFLTRAIFRVGHGQWAASERRAAAMAVRVVLLFGLGLPYIVAVAMTFHPKIKITPDPRWQQLGAQEIAFSSTDGLNISGIWIPAADAPRGKESKSWGQDTVIICHGMGENKWSHIDLAGELISSGYNVLAFDFRGFGQSDGNIVSFGDREKFDVLGAVRWLKQNEPQRSSKIDGIGIDTGAAALLAAAGEASPEAREINSLVILGCYDRFASLAEDATADYILPPVQWITLRLGIPMASLQTGVDLQDFSPADAALAAAPRPILFIHNKRDRIVRFERGEKLFDLASAPKTNLWLDNVEDDDINAPGVNVAARRFLDEAVPMI